MKFRCVNSIKDKSNADGPAQKLCSEVAAMYPRELFLHFAFKCQPRQKLNKYTLKTRDLNICRFFCTLKSFDTTQIKKNDLYANKKKFNCGKCNNSAHFSTDPSLDLTTDADLGNFVRRQCFLHIDAICFEDFQIRHKDERKNN